MIYDYFIIIMKKCDICFLDINDEIFEDHIGICINEQINLLDSIKKPVEIQKEYEFTECQKIGFKYALKKSKIHAKSTYDNCVIRFKDLGFDENILKKVIEHISNDVKITMNINTATIEQIIRDRSEHCKNLYEIGRGNSGRSNWETNLFHGAYDKAEHRERVKYGALNLFQSNSGIASCYGYGNVHFVLKKHINKRTSFVCGDSASMMFHICTFKYNNQLLLFLEENILKDLINHVLSENKNYNYYKNYNYVEAQIHGFVRFDTDIESLVIKRNLLTKSIENFCYNNKIQIKII